MRTDACDRPIDPVIVERLEAVKIIHAKVDGETYYVQYDPKDTDHEYGVVTIKQTATLFETEDAIEKAMMRLRFSYPHIDNWKASTVWFRVTPKGKYD